MCNQKANGAVLQSHRPCESRCVPIEFSTFNLLKLMGLRPTLCTSVFFALDFCLNTSTERVCEDHPAFVRSRSSHPGIRVVVPDCKFIIVKKVDERVGGITCIDCELASGRVLDIDHIIALIRTGNDDGENHGDHAEENEDPLHLETGYEADCLVLIAGESTKSGAKLRTQACPWLTHTDWDDSCKWVVWMN